MLGTSRNAAPTQIWVATGVDLMTDSKLTTRTDRSLREISRLVHLDLLHRRHPTTPRAGQDRGPVPK